MDVSTLKYSFLSLAGLLPLHRSRVIYLHIRTVYVVQQWCYADQEDVNDEEEKQKKVTGCPLARSSEAADAIRYVWSTEREWKRKGKEEEKKNPKSKAFSSMWKMMKKRNDGKNEYGENEGTKK